MVKWRVELTVIALVFVAAACSRSRMVNVWQDPNRPKPGYTSVLVVAVTDNHDFRRTVENAFVTALRARGVTAVPDYEVIPAGAPMNRATVEEVVAAGHLEAVLAVRIRDVDRRAAGGAAPPAGYGHRNDSGDFYGYYRSAIAPPPPADYAIVTLESIVFDSQSAQRVWSATTETKAFRDPRSEKTELAELVVKALVKQQIVRGQ